MRSPALFVARRDGRVGVDLGSEAPAVIADLARQAIAMLDAGDSAMARLFPDAYRGDAMADATYRSIMGADLLASHRANLESLLEVPDRDVVDLATLERWMGGVEALRLVLGTRLEVTEDTEVPAPDHPDFSLFALYQFLSGVQGEMVDVLAAQLPDGGREPAG